jgi:hypothetical protein
MASRGVEKSDDQGGSMNQSLLLYHDPKDVPHVMDDYIVGRAKGASQSEIRRLVKELQDRRETITISPWIELRSSEKSRPIEESKHA